MKQISWVAMVVGGFNFWVSGNSLGRGEGIAWPIVNGLCGVWMFFLAVMANKWRRD